nr:hypothetical protein [Tanacetum cinerariifolium]
MRFNDHVMENLSQRDVLNRSNELNLNEDSYEEIRSKELGKNGEQTEEISGMDGRGVDVCNENNGTRNELSMEEHDKMSSSQKTPIQTTANEDVKKSSRVFGCAEFEVNPADKCDTSRNCINDKDDEIDGDNRMSALASSLGRPILMDPMTAMMCHKDIGNLEFARVLVEMEPTKELKIQVKLPMRFNDHVMENLSQRDVLNRSNELNLNEDSYEEIRSKELGKNGEQTEEISGMDGRGVDVCNENNGTRNELSMEEHDKMSSSQ